MAQRDAHNADKARTTPGADFQVTNRGDIEEAINFVVKVQQLAGRFPSKESIDLVRRMLRGEIAREPAYAEVRAKYGRG